ncbi:hypothetical protein [Corallococcus sp. AB038B]|uniref:hypothetical protein n=1 Tax=Corallococcus sp. AB038B TaxID=2316718 RepID=UPI000EB91486|nr:hypothetical protein [Corallococcus sp. AB038B]RKI04412.1 hypothetical protein D7Y04_05655 [Corallococcus sp. AB038B]
MTNGVKCAGFALVLALTVGPGAAWAQVDEDDGSAVVVDLPEIDRGCPVKPEFLPMTPMGQVGIDRLGWLVHQAIIPPSKDKFFLAGARSRSGVKPVPMDQSKKLGALDTTKAPIWVFGKEKSKACKGTPIAYWAVRMGTDEDRQTYLMAELAMECEVLPPGRLAGTPVALRQKDEPTGCVLRRPNRSHTGKESDGIPPDYAEHIPPQDCAAPECARLWEYFGVTGEEGEGSFDLTVSYLHKNGSNPCNWASDDLSMLFVRGRESTALTPLKPGGQLFGGLWDFSGPRFILSREMGVLYAYDYQKLKAAPKAVRYGSPTEEDLIHAKRTLSPCKK